MFTRDQWQRFIDHPVVEWSIFVLGALLIILSPLAGVIPGPGGIFVFAIGLAMVLKTSMWAKRRYVRFKRWQPKAGRWADWGLRRESAKRRLAIAKERIEPGAPAHEDTVAESSLAAGIPEPPASSPVEAPSSVFRVNAPDPRR